MPDQEFVCRECGAAYVFTETEQEFFRTQGFSHPPKRCKACRARQRQRDGRDTAGARTRDPGAPLQAPHAPHDVAALATGQGLARSAEPVYGEPFTDAPPPPRPPRPRGPMHTTTCSVCGLATEVPFVPDGVRPVYCLPCLKKQTR